MEEEQGSVPKKTNLSKSSPPKTFEGEMKFINDNITRLNRSVKESRVVKRFYAIGSLALLFGISVTVYVRISFASFDPNNNSGFFWLFGIPVLLVLCGGY